MSSVIRNPSALLDTENSRVAWTVLSISKLSFRSPVQAYTVRLSGISMV